MTQPTLQKMRGQAGVSALETALLIAAIGIPLMVLVFVGIRILAAHYGMASTLNALPIS